MIYYRYNALTRVLTAEPNYLVTADGAMYDRANPTVGMNPDGSPRADGLYRNRGTGAFVIGPDKTA